MIVFYPTSHALQQLNLTSPHLQLFHGIQPPSKGFSAQTDAFEIEEGRLLTHEQALRARTAPAPAARALDARMRSKLPSR